MSVDMNFKAEPNGSLSFSNERTQITFRTDGTIVISTRDPLQLTGACLMKIDALHSKLGPSLSKAASQEVLEALEKRI